MVVGKDFQNSSLLKEIDEYQIDQVELLKIKEVYIVPNDANLPNANDFETPVLIIADTMNHCLRSINLVEGVSKTLAG